MVSRFDFVKGVTSFLVRYCLAWESMTSMKAKNLNKVKTGTILLSLIAALIALTVVMSGCTNEKTSIAKPKSSTSLTTTTSTAPVAIATTTAKAIITTITISTTTSTIKETDVAKPDNPQVKEVDGKENQKEILSKATHASVNTISKNWDADAEDDGMIVFPDLKDENDNSIKFDGYELPVEIKIYTTKFENFKQVNDRLVYSGSGKIDSWKDGNFLMGGGIKIPFDDIQVKASDSQYGAILISIALPDGRKMEAKSNLGVAIRPQ